MNLGCWPIETDCEPRKPAVLQLHDCLAGQQGRCARSHRGPQSQIGGVPDEFVNVGSLERIAARDDEQRGLQLDNVLDQALRLTSRELQRIARRLCASATVHARQVARLRGFPMTRNG